MEYKNFIDANLNYKKQFKLIIQIIKGSYNTLSLYQ